MSYNVLKILLVVLLGFAIFGLSACSDNKNKYDMSSLNDDMDDENDFEEYIEKARQSAKNEDFSSAYSYLKQARKLGVSNSELSIAKEYVSRQEDIYNEKIRQNSMNQNYSDSAGENLKDKCAILVDDFVAYSACIGDEESVFGNNLKAYYAIRRECSSLAGIDDRGLSYLCQNPNPNGCVGLKASQDTINACYQCGGSNLWLRVYAAGKVLKCY